MEALFTVVSNCRVSDTITKESSGCLPDYNNANDDQDNYGRQPGDSLQLSILCHAERWNGMQIIKTSTISLT
jgi:hypothetical protein